MELLTEDIDIEHSESLMSSEESLCCAMEETSEASLRSEVDELQRKCPVGWLAWFHSNKYHTRIPCVVLQPQKFALFAIDEDDVVVSPLVLNKETRHFAKYKMSKLSKRNRPNKLDFCYNFRRCFNMQNTNEYYTTAIHLAIKLVGIRLQIHFLEGASYESSYEWALHHLHKYSPMVFTTAEIQFFYTTDSEKCRQELPSQLPSQSNSVTLSNKMKTPKRLKSLENENITPFIIKGEVSPDVKDNLSLPMKTYGFIREVRERRTISQHACKWADVYYASPEGIMLKSRPEVDRYLERNKITQLTAYGNFSFKTRILNLPGEIRTGGRTKNPSKGQKW